MFARGFCRDSLGANHCDANGHREDLQRCQGSKDAVLCDAQRRTLHQLKTYFGASASFGHTCAMLAAASAARNQGTALIVGLVQTHGRAETESMALDLPRLPLKAVPYRDRVLLDFDRDAALACAQAKPDPLLMLGEFTHGNATAEPGKKSRHLERWQDVKELLGAGGDVW